MKSSQGLPKELKSAVCFSTFELSFSFQHNGHEEEEESENVTSSHAVEIQSDSDYF